MENTISQKLNSLVELQAHDRRLDEIKLIKGSLPEEIHDIENTLDEIQGKINLYDSENEKINEMIQNFNEEIKVAESLIVKYSQQLENVRNNREYNALTKEKESQELDIKVYEKRKTDLYEKMETIKENIEELNNSIEEHKLSLSEKKVELEEIANESAVEEKEILKQRETFLAKIDHRLLSTYEKLRKNAKNGYAVVEIRRSACGGCFSIVQPQKFFDVTERKKIVHCEHCGRIFSNVIEEVIEEPVPRRGRRKVKKD